MAFASLKCVFIVALLLLLQLSPAIAKVCDVHHNLTVWKHQNGMFRKTNIATKMWKEYNAEYAEIATYIEESRDGTNIVLYDASRGLRVLLKPDICGVRTEKELSFQQLYSGGYIGVADCSQ